MESYTAIPYTERTPRPTNPILRPAYQGSNPVADIFSLWALRTTVEHLPRIAKNPGDSEARRQMLYSHFYVKVLTLYLTYLNLLGWHLHSLESDSVMLACTSATE